MRIETQEEASAVVVYIDLGVCTEATMYCKGFTSIKTSDGRWKIVDEPMITWRYSNSAESECFSI